LPNLVGHARTNCPTHAATKQALLLNGLGRTDIMQLKRTVGGAHDHRYSRQVGLDHSRMNLCRRSAAGGDQHRGPASREPYSKGKEGRGAFINTDMQSHPVLARQPKSQRRGT
jgi:hypothetical protein